MLTKDLFSTKFERELHEGAIDNLEARYIDDLNRKMDDLLARARQATDPAHKAALKREYEQVKNTRAEYFGANKNTNLEEGAMKEWLWKEAERLERDDFIANAAEYGMTDQEASEWWDSINGMDEAGIGQDIVNRTEKMARATPPTPVGKVASTVKNAAKWLAGKGGPGKEGPTYEGADDIEDSGEYDREGDMAKDNIHTIVRNAQELASILGDDDNLPEWVQDKLANIKGMMTAVSEYMQTQHERNHSGIQKKSSEEVAEHGGGIGPKQHWQDLMPEGFQDFNKVEPYAVCLAGKPVKKFDYYEEARRFHDNWKQKLYREGNMAKAEKITLMPLNLDEMDKSQRPPSRHGDYPIGAKGTTVKPTTPKKVVKDLTKVFDKAFDTKEVKEAGDRVDPILYKALDRMQPGIAGQGQPGDDLFSAARTALATEWGLSALRSEYATATTYTRKLIDLYLAKHGAKQGVAEGNPNSDPWYVYAKQNPKNFKKFKTYNAAKAYAEKHGLTCASASHFHDHVSVKGPQGVDEAQTDYQKRRQRERDVDAGKPVSRQPKNPQTDYARKRAKEKRDLELFGEDTVQIPHKGKMVSGKVVRKDPVSGEYIVDVGEYGSVRVPAHKVKHGVEEEKTRLDPKCWTGKKIGNPKTKVKGGVRVNNCVPVEEDIYMEEEPSPVESAIIRRIMVSHLDWLQKFGPEKVMQAAEEVAYNVGDVDEIGTSDVSAYVHEVGQILGAV